MPIGRSRHPPRSPTRCGVLKLEDKFAEGREYFDDDPKVELKKNGIVEADFTDKKPWDLFPAAPKSPQDLGHLRGFREGVRRQRLFRRRRRRGGQGPSDVDGERRQAGPGQHSRPSRSEKPRRFDQIAQKPSLSPHSARGLAPAEKHRSLAHVRGELPAMPATHRFSRVRHGSRHARTSKILAERADHRRYAEILFCLCLFEALPFANPGEGRG